MKFEFKQSRIAYFLDYFFVFICLALFVFFPTNQNIFSFLLKYLSLIFVLILIIESEIKLNSEKYTLTEDFLLLEKGILTKQLTSYSFKELKGYPIKTKKVFPSLKIGTIQIFTPKPILLKNLRNVDKVMKILEDKIRKA